MGRLLSCRLSLTGTLTLGSPLSLGGADGGLAVDHVVARDGAGDLYIPGTSLAGALSSHFEANAGHRDGALWGTAAAASRMFFNDLPLKLSGDIEVRDGIAIEPETGGSAFGLKFSREVVPAGATARLRITCDAPPSATDAAETAALEVLALISGLLESGAISLGGRTSRGLGAVRLSGAQISRLRLDDRAALIRQLLGKPETVPKKDWPNACLVSGNTEVMLNITPLGPIMVKAAGSAETIDQLPLVTRRNGAWHMVIPGSSLAGVLRSIALRIVRSLGAHEVLAEILFGRARQSGAQDGLGRSAIDVPDMHATSATEPARWFKSAKKGFVPAEIKGSDVEVAIHVALDRWTGAPVDHALFTSIEPWGVELEPVRLFLRAGRLRSAAQEQSRHALARLSDDQVVDAAKALLLQTLREFSQHNPGIGFGTTRGYGAVSASFSGLSASQAMKDAWTEYLKVTP